MATMTVNELHAKLAEAIAEGKGGWPAEVMCVVNGAPISVEIVFADTTFEEDDGQHFWLHCGDAFAPEWMGRLKLT